MNNLQEQGRAHYKRGEYREAIEIFDRAIGRAPSVQLLDNRAACYEKLNELPAALQDAKKSIQQHREDATGYLRAGKVLMKMHKPGVALDIYTHGLKCIKHVGQGYQLLKKVHKEVLDIVSPPKSVDPLTVLPRELAETVLEYLSFRQRMNACLVSPGWTQFIHSTPTLWTHLDLSGAKKKVRTAFISRAINVGRSRLRQATLNVLYDFDKTIVALVQHCPLEELTLFEVPQQGDLLAKELKLAKHLKSLKIKTDDKFHSVVNPGRLLYTLSDRIETFWAYQGIKIFENAMYDRLTEFHVRMTEESKLFDCLLNVAERMPNIQSVTIHQKCRKFPPVTQHEVDLSNCAKLAYLDLVGDFAGFTDFILPTSLVTLKFVSDSAYMRLPLLLQMLTYTAVHDLPRLEELSVLMHETSPHHGLDSFLERHEHGNPISASHEGKAMLRSLTLGSGTMKEVPIAEVLSHPRLHDLETVSFAWCGGFDDESVAVVVEKLPKLRSLDLTGCDVTGVGVKEATKAKCLERLVLNDCRSLSADAVDWAREKGIKVQYKMKGESAWNSRVPYH